MSKEKPSSLQETIVIVCMLDSIHTARWLESVENLPYQYVLFPSTPHRRIHPKIQRIVKNESSSAVFSLWSLSAFSIPLWILDQIVVNRVRSALLRHLIKRRKARLVHAIEFQNAGYVARRACSDIDIPLYITNWGSDIYWFARFTKHRQELEKLMKRANYYSSECHRDHRLALQMGFSGVFFPVVPNAGGLDLVKIAQTPKLKPSDRRAIVVKGYTNFVGRADVVIKAISRIEQKLSGFDVIVYSATLKARLLVRKIQRSTSINIRGIPKKRLSHEEMMTLFSSARVYVGVSESDGISTSMLEAMSNGCFPIQTSSACVDEWVEDGVTAIFIDEITEEVVALALERALTDDSLVDNAARLNWMTAQKRIHQDEIRETMSSFYPIILKKS